MHAPPANPIHTLIFGMPNKNASSFLRYLQLHEPVQTRSVRNQHSFGVRMGLVLFCLGYLFLVLELRICTIIHKSQSEQMWIASFFHH